MKPGTGEGSVVEDGGGGGQGSRIPLTKVVSGRTGILPHTLSFVCFGLFFYDAVCFQPVLQLFFSRPLNNKNHPFSSLTIVTTHQCVCSPVFTSY